MARSNQAWNKQEREKNKQKKRQDKEKKKEDRKTNPISNYDNMIAYVDENGQISSVPPDPAKKSKIIAEQIETGVPRRENKEEPDTEREGIVTFFNDSKGFGFIRDLKTQESIFTHVNSHIDTIKENDKVSFKAVKGQKGLNAVDVKIKR
jgi:cold shock CspA family protein